METSLDFAKRIGPCPSKMRAVSRYGDRNTLTTTTQAILELTYDVGTDKGT
jgi:hypothetical protein